jgi:tetratricopeptide (TPR) repeat protein
LKRLIVSTILLLLTANLLSPVANAQQAQFDRATEFLTEQNYREAISEYQTIVENGHESGALWYNLGIAYSQLDSLGLAKYHFLKAAEHQETEREALAAVDYVNDRFSRRSAVLPPLPWDRFFNYLEHDVGIESLFLMGFIFLYIGILSLLIFWFYKKYQTYSYYFSISSLFMSLVLFATSYYVQYLDNRYDTGVVIDRESVVYQTPDSTSAAISTAYEGYTMRVDNHTSNDHQDWIYVRLENGMKGWIQDRHVKLL